MLSKYILYNKNTQNKRLKQWVNFQSENSQPDMLLSRSQNEKMSDIKKKVQGTKWQGSGEDAYVMLSPILTSLWSFLFTCPGINSFENEACRSANEESLKQNWLPGPEIVITTIKNISG